MTDSVQRAGVVLGQVARQLAAVSGNTQFARDLLALLGWAPPPGLADIGLTQLNASHLVQRLAALDELRSREDAPAAEVAVVAAGVADALIDLFDSLRQLAAGFQATPDYLAATGIHEQFFPRLADMLVIQAVGMAGPALIPLGMLTGLFELKHQAADPARFQIEHVRQTVRWDRLGPLLRDPADTLREVYGWGTPQYAGRQLVMHLGALLEHFCDNLTLQAMSREVEEAIVGLPVPQADGDPAPQLMASIAKGLGHDAFDVGVSLYPLRVTSAGGSDGGLGLSPYVIGTSQTRIALSEFVSLDIAASADVQSGMALLIRAGSDPELKTGLLDAPAAATASSSLGLTLRVADPEGGRLALFSGASVKLDVAALRAGIGFTGGSELDPTLRAGIDDGRLTIAPDPDDGFMASLLPAQGISANLALDLDWSQRFGLRVRGGAGLATTLSLHRRLGPLRLDTIDLTIGADGEGVAARALLSGAVSLGPLTAVVTGTGAEVALRFRPGNLGAVDLGGDFVPPSGIGLVVDVPGVLTGGGLLFRDPLQPLYAGVLQLALHETINVSAFGLVATRLPDGSKGYSLLVFITADGFQPIQLGLGFTLLGVGGMVAIHRTFDEAVLRNGLKNDTLASLLFPRDPVSNAAAIIRAVATAFPARSGSYLVGLLARIGWFTPTLVTADLALIVELGARKRILVLGRVRAALPSAEHVLLRINLDAIGVFDLDAGTAAIDAVLVDSRLLGRFTITGAAALRARWSKPRSFALAIGGMNKAFTLPAQFPQLERVTLSLTTGDNPRVTCQAYFALTSNTVQFGAAAYLYASAHGFSVTGAAGFDVLIQLSPFHFLAEFFAGMQLKRGSTNLFKVKVEGALEGPAPLTVRAKCSFEIFWWDVSIRVNATLAAGTAPPLPAAVDVLGQLQQALRDERNWSAELPAAQTRVVTLREAATNTTMRVHPLATLVVRQAIVPLNLQRDIDRFGDAPVAGPRRFNTGPALLGGQTVPDNKLRDDFAPAQFFEMSDNDKLAAPQYEEMDAGIVFGSPAASLDLGHGIASALEFETKVVDAQAAPDEPPPYTLDHDLMVLHARFGAAGRSVLRRIAERPTPFARLRRGGFAVIDEDLAAQPGANNLSFAEARAIARALPARRSVPTFELVD